jgi:hypothetical protein
MKEIRLSWNKLISLVYDWVVVKLHQLLRLQSIINTNDSGCWRIYSSEIEDLPNRSSI